MTKERSNPVGRFPLSYGQRCADKLLARLRPHCERIEVAGSIRRRRPDCGDVDLVIIPRVQPELDLLGNVTSQINLAAREIRAIAQSLGGVVIKDGNSYLVIEAGGVQVDVWFGTLENFGSLWMCRTGSKEHNIWLAEGAKRRGGHWNPHHGLHLGGRIVGETEERIYAALGVPFLPPESRDTAFPRIR